MSRSSDGGATWTTTLVEGPQPFPEIDQFSNIAIAADGTLDVAWRRCNPHPPEGFKSRVRRRTLGQRLGRTS